MAASHQISADITPSLASIRSSINKIKSAMSKVTLPVNLNVTKRSIKEAHGKVKLYFADKNVYINIAVSRSSLASARKQLQASLSAVSIPQISLRAGVSRQIASLISSLDRLQNAGPSRAAASVSGGGGAGRSGGGRSGGGYGRNSSGGLNLPLGHLSGEASEFSKSMDAATARVFAFGATAVVINSVVQSFRALVVNSIEVEKKLTEIKAIFGESEASFARFRDTIFDVAANTGQSFATTAEGAAELARQGLSAAETAERLNAALVLTRNSGIGADDSVKSLTAALNGFTSAGLTADKVVNKVFAVDVSFAVSAKDLTDGFARAGSTAEDAGVSFDQLLGLITALQQKTARGGAVIGNGLKTIFTRISRGTVIEQLKELGVQIDASQNGIQKLQAIGEAFESASADPVRQAKIKELSAGGFQINLISAALKDLNSEQSLFTAATKVSQNASTEAFDRNREQNETLAAQINGLVVSLTNLSEKIGQVSFIPLLKGFSENAKGISDSLSNSLNPDAGFTLAKAFFDGFGSFIKGPLALVFLAGFGKLFLTVSGFAKQGLQDVLRLNGANKSSLAIQNAITGALERNARVQGLIANQTITTRARTFEISNEINRMAIAEQLRLETLRRITAELQRQGGFLRQDGSIGFDRGRVDRFRRRAGEIAQSPGFAVAASIGVGAGVGALKNTDSNQVKAESFGRQIDLLKDKLSKLNPEIDGLKIENLNQSIERLTRSQDEAAESSEKYQASIDRIGVVAASTVALYSLTGNKLVGIGGLLGTVALALREFVLEPFFQRKSDEAESRRDAIMGDGISVSSQEDKAIRFQAAQDRLSKGFDALTTSVLKSAQSFNSELKQRTKSQSLAEDFKTDDFDFLKTLNDLRPDSQSKREAKRDIERRSSLVDSTKAIEKLAQSGNSVLNTRAQEVGFTNISKIPSGDLKSLVTPTINAFRDGFDPKRNKISGLLTGQLSPTSRKALLRPQDASNDEIKKLGEELSDLKNATTPLGVAMKDLGENIKNTASGQNILKTQTDLVNFIERNIKTADPTNQTSVDAIVNGLDRFLAEGIGDENSAEEILGAINKERSVDRNFQLEDLQARINLMKEGEKSALDALNKSKTDRLNQLTKEKEAYLDKIEKEKELNDSFLEDLRKIYGQDIDRIRALEGDSVSKGLTVPDFKDFASKNMQEVLNALGIEGSEQKGITGEVSRETFTANLFRESTKDFFDTFSKLDNYGQKITLSETDQRVLSEKQKNRNPEADILGAASTQAERRALRPFIDASNALKNAKSSDDLARAEALFRQGQAGLGSLSLTEGEDASLRKGLLELAQQIVLVGTIFRSQGIRAEGSNSEDAFTATQEKREQYFTDVSATAENFYSNMEQKVELAFSGAIDAAVAATIRGIENATQTVAGGTDINRQAAFGASNAAAQKTATGTVDTTNVGESMSSLGEVLPGVVTSFVKFKEALDAAEKEKLIGQKDSPELAEKLQIEKEFEATSIAGGMKAFLDIFNGSFESQKDQLNLMKRIVEVVLNKIETSSGVPNPFAKPD